MGNRYKDWFKQALSDLKHSLHACEDGDYDWACFAAHQAAEKAVKALIEFSGGTYWGHAISKLLTGIEEHFLVTQECKEHALFLDKFYIPTRYPNGFDSGAPVDYYSRKDAEAAYEAAEFIINFCQSHLP